MPRLRASTGQRQALQATPTALDRHRREMEAGTAPASPDRPPDPAMAPMSVAECLGEPLPAAPGGPGLAPPRSEDAPAASPGGAIDALLAPGGPRP